MCGLEKTGSHASYCKPCNSARVMEWKRANKEKYNSYMKNYAKKSKRVRVRKPLTDKQRIAATEYKARWRSENLDKYREYDRKRRASKLNNGFEKYSEEQVLSMYGDACHICNNLINLDANRSVGLPNWEMSLHIDHLIPISKGGSDSLENVRPAHALCNLKKSSNMIE